MRTFILVLLTTLALPVIADSRMAGEWQINLTETDKVTVEFKKGSGVKTSKLRGVSVSVMGLPLPSSYRQSAMSSLPPKDPQVLLCTTMGIDVTEKKINLKYDEDGKESLIKGHYRGRDTKISKRKVEQKYKTPERTVTKTWRLRDDGRLLVSVKIKYRGDKAQVYNRVFDRVSLAHEPS
jgi:hypothetical protein